MITNEELIRLKHEIHAKKIQFIVENGWLIEADSLEGNGSYSKDGVTINNLDDVLLQINAR